MKICFIISLLKFSYVFYQVVVERKRYWNQGPRFEGKQMFKLI